MNDEQKLELIARLASQVAALALKVCDLSTRVEKLEHPRQITAEQMEAMCRQAAGG